MAIFGKIIGWVTGGIFDKVFGGFLDYRNQKSRIEAGMLESVIQSDLEINRMKMHMAAINKEWWVTRWIMPSFAYPVAAWWTAVILDSIFHFGWKVSALPHPLNDWAGQIILSFFIIGTTQSLVKQWLNRGLVSSVIENVKSVVGGNRKGREK